jgi:hypothetical protein
MFMPRSHPIAGMLLSTMFGLRSQRGLTPINRQMRNEERLAGGSDRLAKAQAKRKRRGEKLRKIVQAGGMMGSVCCFWVYFLEPVCAATICYPLNPNQYHHSPREYGAYEVYGIKGRYSDFVPVDNVRTGAKRTQFCVAPGKHGILYLTKK